MEIKIPKKFKIVNREIKVEFDKTLLKHEDCMGLAEYRLDRIRIQPSSEANPRTDKQIEETYLHEITHWILHIMDYDDLCGDEEFIKRFSRALHQILITSE